MFFRKLYSRVKALEELVTGGYWLKPKTKLVDLPEAVEFWSRNSCTQEELQQLTELVWQIAEHQGLEIEWVQGKPDHYEIEKKLEAEPYHFEEPFKEDK
jgi:phosphoenolpyruvate synthase/pyruvate phosphate dikinase